MNITAGWDKLENIQRCRTLFPIDKLCHCE